MSYIQNNEVQSNGTKKLYLFMIARYLLNNNSEKYIFNHFDLNK